LSNEKKMILDKKTWKFYIDNENLSLIISDRMVKNIRLINRKLEKARIAQNEHYPSKKCMKKINENIDFFI